MGISPFLFSAAFPTSPSALRSRSPLAGVRCADADHCGHPLISCRRRVSLVSPSLSWLGGAAAAAGSFFFPSEVGIFNVKLQPRK